MNPCIRTGCVLVDGNGDRWYGDLFYTGGGFQLRGIPAEPERLAARAEDASVEGAIVATARCTCGQYRDSQHDLTLKPTADFLRWNAKYNPELCRLLGWDALLSELNGCFKP